MKKETIDIRTVGDDLRKAYEQGLEDGKPKWIPVSERLPKQYSKVLAFVDGYGIVTASLEFDERWNTNHIKIGITKNVTHWMPLPEPPKEETDVLL